MKTRNIIHTFLEAAEAFYGVLTPERTEQVAKVQQAYRSFQAKALAERKPLEVMADTITQFFGSIDFAILHIGWFILWFVINLGYLPGVTPFDPFPFGLLTMIVSLEAIFLSIFVLMSQNRESQISNLREEIDFQINMQAEQEITKVLQMVNEIHTHLKLSKKRDKELETMKKKLDPEKIEQEIVQEEGLKENH